MPGLNESFFASKSLSFAIAGLAFLAAVVLLSVIFRLTFGRRLRLPRNGRARLPRLGTVDAFDLDRQRQLVIIRRDNVEHLLMIGGPNDLVIESQIIRAETREPRDFREARIRDKELREKEQREVSPLPAGVPWPFPGESPSPNPPQRKMPFPPAAMLEPETGVTDSVPIEEPMPGFAPSPVLSNPRPPAHPKPPRRVSAPAAAPSGQRTPSQREPLLGRTDPVLRSGPATNSAKEFRMASVATPFLRSATHRQEEESGVRIAPSSAPEVPVSPSPPPGFEEISVPPEANAGARSEPAEPANVPAAPVIDAGDLFPDAPEEAGLAKAGADTLEAEMAKLLGRGPR